jgi:hypothetical protein
MGFCIILLFGSLGPLVRVTEIGGDDPRARVH